jgi:AAA+ ATPase superfamily predicted ATPase
MHSPFPYERLSSKEEFFGREAELKKLTQAANYSTNLLIHSKRRMGKSSLINRFFSQNEEKFITIYCDIFDITSKEELANALLKSAVNAQKQDLKTTLAKFLDIFKCVRVEPVLNTKTLEYSIKPIVTALSFDEMMEDFFTLLETLARTEKVVLAIDEFQQIATLKEKNIDALLRKFIQRQNNISFVFLGSKRHLLTSLFSYKAPLYEMAQHFELPPLRVNDIYAYASKHLDISKEITQYVFQQCDGETKMIQHVLHLLYVNDVSKINKQSVDESIKEIIDAKDASYRLLYDSLANTQKTALKIVAKYKKGFFKEDIFREYRIKKQTLQSAINALFTKELIDKDKDIYFIPDRTLELWAQMKL